MASQASFIEILQQFSTCDISDALVQLRYPHGGYLPNISLWSPRRQEGDTKIVGPAYTVQYVRKGTRQIPPSQGHFIDTVPAGAVILIDSPLTVNAVFGGLMTRRARACNYQTSHTNVKASAILGTKLME